MTENEISDLTRRDLFDELCLAEVNWAGRFDEDAFLARIFDLKSMRSTDRREPNMAADVHRHRVSFGKVDWGDDWVYSDARLNLLWCPDDVLFQFLCQMIHPSVRPDKEEVAELLAVFNRHLAVDGYEIAVGSYVSKRPVYAARRLLEGIGGRTHLARQVADDLRSDVISSQISRMEASIVTDPALAIGSAKEFVETVCKGILAKTGAPPSGNEDLPKLVKLTRERLGLVADNDAGDTLRKTLSSLSTITQGICELRGQVGTGHGPAPDAERPSPIVARLAVGSAVALGVFLFETYSARVPVVAGQA